MTTDVDLDRLGTVEYRQLKILHISTPVLVMQPVWPKIDPNGMDNSYFTLLLDEKWVLSKRNVDPPQFEDARTGELMMLPTDMALLVDPAFRKYVDLYAKDTETWQRDFAAAFGKLLENGVPR